MYLLLKGMHFFFLLPLNKPRVSKLFYQLVRYVVEHVFPEGQPLEDANVATDNVSIHD